MQFMTTSDNLSIIFHADGDVTGADGCCFCRASLGTPEARKAAGQWLALNLGGMTFAQAVAAYRSAVKRAVKGAL